METSKDTQPQETKVEEVKPQTDTVVATDDAKTEVAPKVDAEPEATVAQVMVTEKKADKVDSVPLAVFLEEKKERKDLEKQIADLQKQVTAGKKLDVGDEIQALGEEYGVDADFLAKLTTAIETRVKGGGEVSPEVAKLLEEHNTKELDAVFKTHFDKAITKMPEYAEIANRDVIKALSLLPENANKTFSQIIEDTYGRSIPGKATIETTTPGGGKEPEPIDYARASKDQAYLTEVLSDPAKRAEYNKDLHKRLKL